MRVRSAEQRLDERNARLEWVIPGAQLLARVGEFWITSHESVLFFAYTRPKRVHKPATADESKDPSQRLGAYGGLGDLFSVRYLRYSPLSSFR